MTECKCEWPLIKCDANGCYCTVCRLPDRLPTMGSRPASAAFEQVFNFLNSIEGAGYGGMAEFEIARETMRRASEHSRPSQEQT